MAYLKDTIRSSPGGSELSGATVQIFLEKNDVDITDQGSPTSITTSAVAGQQGSFTWTFDGHPGDFYYRASVGSEYKYHSTRSVGPARLVQLGELHNIFRVFPDGVLQNVNGELAVTTGTGRTFTLGTGSAVVKGHIVTNYNSRVLNNAENATMYNGANLEVPANTTLATRLDYLVIRVYREDHTTDAGRCVFVYRTGTVNNTLPTLTQSSTIWEYPLYSISLAQNTNSDVWTSLRTFWAAPQVGLQPRLHLESRRNAAGDVAITGVGADNTILSATLGPLTTGVVFDIIGLVDIEVQPDSGNSVSAIVEIDGDRGGISTRSRTSSLYNVHHKPVTGTGATIPVKVHIQKQSGSANYREYTIHFRADPRA